MLFGKLLARSSETLADVYEGVSARRAAAQEEIEREELERREQRETLDALKSHPLFVAANAEAAAKRMSDRQAVAQSLAQIDVAADVEVSELRANLVAAEGEVVDLERKLQAAKSKFSQAQSALMLASDRFARAKTKCERELDEGADPAIEAFIDRMNAILLGPERHLAREGSVRTARNQISGDMSRSFSSNVDSLRERFDAIRAAIAAASAMKRRPDQAGVRDELAQIAQAMPRIRHRTVTYDPRPIIQKGEDEFLKRARERRGSVVAVAGK